MKNIAHVNFSGYPVPGDKIKEIFEELREALKLNYPAAKYINMPPIKAFTLPQKTYLETERQLLGTEQEMNKVEEQNLESEIGQSSARLFRSTNDDLETWVIIKREGFGNELEHDLEHEIIHIFENLMLMPEGSISVEESPDIEDNLTGLLE